MNKDKATAFSQRNKDKVTAFSHSLKENILEYKNMYILSINYQQISYIKDFKNILETFTYAGYRKK